MSTTATGDPFWTILEDALTRAMELYVENHRPDTTLLALLESPSDLGTFFAALPEGDPARRQFSIIQSVPPRTLDGIRIGLVARLRTA